MMNNFFNRMYYGKAGKGDLTPEDLPTSRWQLFLEMLRIRWGAIIKANLFYIIFLLPVLLWTALNFTVLYTLLSDSIESGAATDTYSIIFQYLVGLIPCIAITGPFTAGITIILRNWARDQHSFFMSDFFQCVKKNWKQALVVSTITGIMPILVYVSWQFYGSMAAANVFYTIPQMFVVCIALVWSLTLTVIYDLMITYDLKLGTLIRNSIILAIGSLPKSVGIRLATLALFIVFLLLILLTPIAGYALLALALYYIVFGFAFSRFITVSYANALCDRFINPRIEGAAVNMGLRQYTDDDYEKDPTIIRRDDDK